MVRITLETSLAVLESEMPSPGQPESVTIGPFSYAQLTYRLLRVSPEEGGDSTGTLGKFDSEQEIWNVYLDFWPIEAEPWEGFNPKKPLVISDVIIHS